MHATVNGQGGPSLGAVAGCRCATKRCGRADQTWFFIATIQALDHVYGIASVVGLFLAIWEVRRRGRLLDQVQRTITDLRRASARASILVLLERLNRLYESTMAARESSNITRMVGSLQQWQEHSPKIVGKANSLPNTTERDPCVAALRASVPLVAGAITHTSETPLYSRH